MPRDHGGSQPKPAGRHLVQSKLTDIFATIRVSRPTSRHLARDIGEESPPNPRPKDAKTSLHPSRRANLKTMTPSLPTSKRSELLAATAQETLDILPEVIKTTPNARPTSELLEPHTLLPASQSHCPNLRKIKIRVINMDTLDAAYLINSMTAGTLHQPGSLPVLVLNMANAKWAGGGWMQGARAQEEAICYRSSLYLSLKHQYYPMADRAAIYSPRVVVIRDSLERSHRLLDLSRPDDLPIVSVVSMAAVRDPPTVRKVGDGEERYARAADRELMRAKIRMVLRVAAAKGHRQLVLGALGCGAFGNPRGEVADLWKEVFLETEFSGGWWKDVVFAVLDSSNDQDADTNYGVFFRGLHGLEI
ncbi:MAG: hypothetical protein L6R40_002526 [Gallowayella cf. fulva]|nr:MAG: hypothetical protein L6R40_002526 [Xanthomendoza cf. fulva]